MLELQVGCIDITTSADAFFNNGMAKYAFATDAKGVFY
jgi:hypothetical protein